MIAVSFFGKIYKFTTENEMFFKQKVRTVKRSKLSYFERENSLYLLIFSLLLNFPTPKTGNISFFFLLTTECPEQKKIIVAAAHETHTIQSIFGFSLFIICSSYK